jgi:hypothetical protein
MAPFAPLQVAPFHRYAHYMLRIINIWTLQTNKNRKSIKDNHEIE